MGDYRHLSIPENMCEENTILKMRKESMKLEQEVPKKEVKTDLVRPSADYRTNNGDDGRAPTRYYIVYSCPKCGRPINEGDIGCLECRIFFDWSKKAKIKQTISVVWE